MIIADLYDQTKGPSVLADTIQQMKMIATKHGFSQVEVKALGFELAKFLSSKCDWMPEQRDVYYSIPPF